jgi:hypothetical protein
MRRKTKQNKQKQCVAKFTQNFLKLQAVDIFLFTLIRFAENLTDFVQTAF